MPDAGGIAPEPIQIGQPDPLGDPVDRILVATDRFTIYAVIPSDTATTTEEDSASWWAQVKEMFAARHAESMDHVWLRTHFYQDYDDAKVLRANLSAIASELALICDVVDSLCRLGSLRPNDRASLRRRATEIMARAMEMAFEGHEDQAKALLANIKHQVTTLRDSRNRMRYVVANVGMLVLLFLLWAGLKLSGAHPDLVLTSQSSPMTVHVFDVLGIGAIGAFFAVSADIRNVKVDHSVSWGEMLYSGAVRVPIGVIAALVAVILISGEWLMSALKADALPEAYLLFGFIAGFSEMFVPNALKQVESSANVSPPEG